MARITPLCILLVVVVALSGCLKLGNPMTDAPAFPSGPMTGTHLSPRDFDDHFASFWDEADDLGPVVAWAGPLHELGTPGGAAAVTARQNAQHGYVTAIRTSPYSIDARDFHEPFTEERRAGYINDLVSFVETHRVAFLELGTEVDLMARYSPDGYQDFVDWWADARAAVKDASPNTKILVSFQYEHMSGRQGGLWGADAGNGTKWPYLFHFIARDLTAFTTFPGMVRADPADLRDDYYDDIATAIAGPVAFTEVGYQADMDIDGWESDPDEQARFVSWFQEHAPESQLTLWTHLYDQETDVPFDAMGLRADDGAARPGLAVWRDEIRRGPAVS